MPKMVDPSQLKFKCPYCDKSYKVQNSLYAHVKSAHPGKTYSITAAKQVEVLYNHVKDEQPMKHSLEEALAKLKQDLVNDKISAEDFIVKRKNIEDELQVEEDKWNEKRTYSQEPNFDFKIMDRVRQQDYDYLTDWIEEHELYNPLINLVKDNLHIKAFRLIFENNVRIEPNGFDDEGELSFRVTFLEYGAKSYEDWPLKMIWFWYSRFLHALYLITNDRRNKIQGLEFLEKDVDDVTEEENYLINAGIDDLKPLDDLCQLLGACTIEKNNADAINQIHSSLSRFDRRLKIK